MIPNSHGNVLLVVFYVFQLLFMQQFKQVQVPYTPKLMIKNNHIVVFILTIKLFFISHFRIIELFALPTPNTDHHVYIMQVLDIRLELYKRTREPAPLEPIVNLFMVIE